MVVKSTRVETMDRMLRTLELSFVKEEDEKAFRYTPGQFCELSILGKGEAPFGIASSPTEKGSLKFTINKAGVVTTALHQLEEGEEIGIRGPLGNSYPIHLFEGKECAGDRRRICLYDPPFPHCLSVPSGSSFQIQGYHGHLRSKNAGTSPL